MSNRPAVEASYPGFCRECDSPYPAGTFISPGPGGWVHETCPPDETEPHREPCQSCWQIPAANGACGCEN